MLADTSRQRRVGAGGRHDGLIPSFSLKGCLMSRASERRCRRSISRCSRGGGGGFKPGFFKTFTLHQLFKAFSFPGEGPASYPKRVWNICFKVLVYLASLAQRVNGGDELSRVGVVRLPR